MATLLPHRDVQRPLILARAAGVIAATTIVALRNDWVDATTELVAWVVVAVVSLGSLLIWGWARGTRSDADLRRIGALGLALDTTLVFGVVWTFVPPHWQAVALLPYVALSAGLRYRWAGAWIGSVTTAIFSIFFFGRLAYLDGTTFDTEGFSFVVALCTVLGCIAGAVADSWHKRRLEFEHQAARLVELDELKDRYIAITSHEIRGPVSTMVTAVDTVRSRWDKLDPERRDHLLEMVYLQGRELDRLVQDLFISAEMQGGGLNLQPEWVELESTIKRAIEAASGKRRAHLLEIFVDPLRVELDPYRVTQIVRNLVENAYKYTDDRTRVVVSAKESPGGVQLEIRDDGEGIPADKRDKLFEAFSRIEETAAGQEGVGLGLYVVSQLVAAMNGRIDLQSSRRGTTFSIYLPCPTVPIDRPHIGLVGGDEERHG